MAGVCERDKGRGQRGERGGRRRIDKPDRRRNDSSCLYHLYSLSSSSHHLNASLCLSPLLNGVVGEAWRRCVLAEMNVKRKKDGCDWEMKE